MDASRQRFAQQLSFRQIARFAEWACGPLGQVSSRFPLLMTHNSQHAEDLCDVLNLRLAKAPQSPRCGWLASSDFSRPERLDIETSISQARTGGLTGEFAEEVQAIAGDALDVYDTILAKIGEHDFHRLLMDTSKLCYVFLRFFPGLRQPCPFVEWVVLPDDEVDAAMDAAAQQWACDNIKTITKLLLAQRKRLGVPVTPSCDQYDEESEACERMLATIRQRYEQGDLAKVPEGLDLSGFMPQENAETRVEPDRVDEADSQPAESSTTDAGPVPPSSPDRAEREDHQSAEVTQPTPDEETTVEDRRPQQEVTQLLKKFGKTPADLGKKLTPARRKYLIWWKWMKIDGLSQSDVRDKWNKDVSDEQTQPGKDGTAHVRRGVREAERVFDFLQK